MGFSYQAMKHHETIFNDFAHIPLEDAPEISPTVYEGISFLRRFGEVWGIFPGYVGKIIEI